MIAELSLKTERLRAAIEILREGVSICDGEGRLELINRRFAEIYGLGPDDVRPGVPVPPLTRPQGADGAALEPPGDPEPTPGGRPRPRTTTIALPEGRFVEIREALAPGGGWVSAHRDVTVVHERGVLVKERLSLQKLIDLVPDNLWLKDAGSRFLIANDATARQIGLRQARAN